MNKLLTKVLSTISFIALLACSANAITLDPALIELRFDNVNSSNGNGNVAFSFFDSVINVDLNEAAGTASVSVNNLDGRVFLGDANNQFFGNSPTDATLDFSFNWTGIVREGDALISTNPSGTGVATITSDFIDGGQIQVDIASLGALNNLGFPTNTGEAVSFYLGQDGIPLFSAGDNFALSAWFGGSQVGFNGSNFNFTGDIHGTTSGIPANAEVPEPATMLLLGSGMLAGAIRRKKA